MDEEIMQPGVATLITGTDRPTINIHAQNVTIINNYAGDAPEASATTVETENGPAFVPDAKDLVPGIENGFRKEVARLAVAMEKRLVEHDAKHPKGWAGRSQVSLLDNLNDAFADFANALQSDIATPKLRDRAADVANYVMMLADNAGALSTQ